MIVNNKSVRGWLIEASLSQQLLAALCCCRRWGNALSPYWQARALALMAGQGFDAYEGFEGGWMQHLPKKLPPTTCPELGRFKEACDQCKQRLLEPALFGNSVVCLCFTLCLIISRSSALRAEQSHSQYCCPLVAC